MPTTPATRLSDLEVDEVSMVDRAAVRDAQNRSEPMRFAMWKRDEKGRFLKKDTQIVPEGLAEAVLKLEEFLGKEPEPETAPPIQAAGGTAPPEPVQFAEWSTAMQNDLPDSSFAHIEPGGKKDDDGKTTPRSLRHLPYKDAGGKIDLPHLRNALARLPQSDLPAAAKASALKTLQAAADKAGVETSKADPESTTKEADNMPELTVSEMLAKIGEADIEKMSDKDKELLANLGSKAKPEKMGEKPGKSRVADPDAGKSDTKKAEEVIPEAIQKQLDDQATRLKKAEEEAAAATLKLAKREMLTKVEKDFQSLPALKAEELVDALIAVEALAPEAYKVLEPAMKSWNEAIKTGTLFTKTGGDGGAVKLGSALHKAEAFADEIQKAEPKLSRAQAMAKVWKGHKALYQEYLKESNNQIAQPAATA